MIQPFTARTIALMVLLALLVYEGYDRLILSPQRKARQATQICIDSAYYLSLQRTPLLKRIDSLQTLPFTAENARPTDSLMRQDHKLDSLIDLNYHTARYFRLHYTPKAQLWRLLR